MMQMHEKLPNEYAECMQYAMISTPPNLLLACPQATKKTSKEERFSENSKGF